MKKTFTLLAMAALMSAPAYSLTVEDVLTLADARGWDTSLDDGFGGWSDKVAPNRFSFLASNGVALSNSTTATVALYLGDTLLASQGTTGTGVDLWLGVFSVDFYNDVQSTAAGTYRLVISDDFLTYNGEAVEGGEYTFEYAGSGNGGNDDEIDFTYNLNPMPTISVDKLGVIELAFPKYLDTDLVAYSMLTDEPVATLSNEDGTFVRNVTYPSAANGVVTFEFGNAETVWPAGKYTFTVNPDKIAVGIANFAVNQPGNFAGFSVTYDVTGFAPAPKPELADYLVTVFPTADCTNVTTADYGNGADGGMMTYIFTATADIQPAPTDTWPEWVSLTFTDAETGDIEYLPSINPNNSDELDIQPIDVIMPLEDGTATYRWTLHFSTDEDWGYSAAMYQRAGTYTLIFPNNTFMLNGEPMNGAQFVYNYTVVPTGVDAIDAAETYVVYTIDGRLVYNGAEKSAINSLDAGLYIINGKKVMVVK